MFFFFARGKSFQNFGKVFLLLHHSSEVFFFSFLKHSLTYAQKLNFKIVLSEFCRQIDAKRIKKYVFYVYTHAYVYVCKFIHRLVYNIICLINITYIYMYLRWLLLLEIVLFTRLENDSKDLKKCLGLYIEHFYRISISLYRTSLQNFYLSIQNISIEFLQNSGQ